MFAAYRLPVRNLASELNSIDAAQHSKHGEGSKHIERGVSLSGNAPGKRDRCVESTRWAAYSPRFNDGATMLH
eukprot:910901-Pleurochrysis_carterae.AAC.1